MTTSDVPAPSAAMTVDREVLGRKLAFLFPAAGEIFRARRLLSEYGREDHEKEVVRVHLAVLKLSGPDLKKVEEYVGAARRDYRDVLAWAEYPGQMRTESWKMGAEERSRLNRSDREQYEKWLREDLPPGTPGESDG